MVSSRMLSSNLLIVMCLSTYLEVAGCYHTWSELCAPDARVIYNDFDDYHVRLANIPRTNVLLADLREILAETPRNKAMPTDVRTRVLERVKQDEDSGYVDYITLSTSLLFAMKYATNYEQLSKETLYNTIRRTDYEADGYLDGIEVVKQDYKALFEHWRGFDNVVFLVDPPYLSTESKTYTGYWKLRDYLDVLQVLNHSNYFYFTSNKSSIIELCDWLEANHTAYNPFNGATRKEIVTQMNFNSKFTDIMLYKHI